MKYFLGCIGLLFALSASQAGTLTLSYSGAPGGSAVNWSATATISDADAVTFTQWCPGYFGFTGTTQACFYKFADSVFASLEANVTNWKQAQPANVVAPIVVTPAQ